MAQATDYSKKASIGVTKRIKSGYLNKGSRFHLREHPVSVVYVAEFDMAHAPVNVYQYAAFINSGAIKDRRWWSEDGWAWLNGASDGWGRSDRWLPDGWEEQRQHPYHPIVGVTLHEAMAYCAWVSFEKKKVVCLPTEDEWEYAARGDDGRPFPWGEYFDDLLANTFESAIYGTVDVASFSGDISPFGVMDMAGNVQQWTASIYQSLVDEMFAGKNQYIARGGSYNDTAFGACTSYRRPYPAGYFYPFLGFRVVIKA